jgi:hypothetical protein
VEQAFARRQSLSQPVTDFMLRINRDDKTAIELFLTGTWGWEAGLRRKLENGKSG